MLPERLRPLLLSTVQQFDRRAERLREVKAQAGGALSLDEAREKVARVAGYASWSALVVACDEADLFCPPAVRPEQKTWYASHDEALAHMRLRTNFYLLPYRGQFFVVDEDYLAQLGVPFWDADVKRVGRDWSRPADAAAWGRIVERLQKAAAARKPQ